MGTLSRSAVALVALVAAVVLVGGPAGCVDDGEYYSSGDPPIAIAPPAGGSPDCEIGVAPTAPSAVDRRAPDGPPSTQSTTSARAEREPSAATDDLEPAGFKTVGCERNAGE